MSKKTENEIRKRISVSQNLQEINRLCLDGIQIKSITPNVKRMLESLVNLQYLTLNNCSLQNLDNFPHLPKLIVLQISDNELQGDDLHKLGHAPEITFLTLDNNNIFNASHISFLSCLPELQILQVHDNPFTNSFDYREPLFNSLQSVKSIDCQDRNGMQVHQEDPSQYISIRQHRSNPNFDDFGGLDEDQASNNQETIQQVTQDNPLKRLPLQSLGGCLYVSQENHRKPPSDIMSIRTKSKEDQEEQNEKPLMSDFLKKMHKKE